MSVYADNIATIRLSYIINNSVEFNKFIKEIESIKSTYFNELKNEESILEKRKVDLEDSKILLNEYEFNKLLENFNNDADDYRQKIQKYENFLNSNIQENEKKMLQEISIITENYSKKNNIDIIFNEDQFFISSARLDISDIIVKKLNKKQIDLKLIKK